MRTYFYLTGLFVLICLMDAAAQAPPSTDIYLVGLTQDMAIHAPDGPVNLTFRDGYDNQPHFTPNGQFLLYTSNREEQTDIYRIELSTRRTEQVTATSESEYSPTVTPSGDAFSVIQVEEDQTQRLWQFDLDGSNPTLLLEEVKPVGYQAWVDTRRVALFILGQPPTLQLADTQSGDATILAESIGRSLHRIPGTSRISFVHKADKETWIVKSVDPITGDIEEIMPTLPAREDYAWLPNGNLIMGDGERLFLGVPMLGSWHLLHDFAPAGFSNITRIAVSPDGRQLAFVADR